MNMHVNPVASDGQFTIGYDANSRAGQWPGNMAEAIDDRDFMPARTGATFCDGNEEWDAHDLGDGEIVWRDVAGNWTPVREVLHMYGDR